MTQCSVSEVEERFMCSICHLVMVEPVETPCGHVFCNGCLHGWLRHSPTCPVDRTHVTEDSVHILHHLAREIRNLNENLKENKRPKAAPDFTETPTVQDNPMPANGRRTPDWSRPYQSLYPVLEQNTSNRSNCEARSERSPLLNDSIAARTYTEVVVAPSSCVWLQMTTFVQCGNWRRRFLASLIIVVILSSIIAALCVPAEEPKPLLNRKCNGRGSDVCNDPSGSLHLSCDLAKQTCLLQAGANCSGEYRDYCVSGAFCDKTNESCVCGDGFHTVNDICVLELGEDCSGWKDKLCLMDEYCDRHETRQCRCLEQYHPSGYICRLKANVPGLRCSQITQFTTCVDNATCDTSTEQCLCDEDFSIKNEGTCGLQVSVRLRDKTCAEFPLCVDYATCSDAQHSCVCEHNFAQRADGTCGLQAEVPGVNCNDVTACVDNAECDAKSGRCLCDENFSVRKDGTCGLKAGVPGIDCRGVSACVENATCDTTSQRCVCDEQFSARRDGICGLQVSVRLDSKTCAEFPPCVDNAACSESQHSCVCNHYFAPLPSNTCGLKAEVNNVDCRQVTACVEHATCDKRNTHTCLCDQYFSIKREGTCGFQVSWQVKGKTCAEFPPCVDNAVCSDDQHSCLCERDFAQLFNRTCGLRTDRPSVDCRAITSCVQYARCQRTDNGHECVCDSGKSVVKSDNTCGLVPNIPTDNCDTTICADSTSCKMDSDSHKYMCQCRAGTNWDRRKSVCESNGASFVKLSPAVVMATTFTCFVLLGWL